MKSMAKHIEDGKRGPRFLRALEIERELAFRAGQDLDVAVIYKTMAILKRYESETEKSSFIVSLYRHFSEDRMLLYVGISLSTLVRLGQHRSHAHWFNKIAYITIEWFENRKQALEAETKARLNEGPLYNKR